MEDETQQKTALATPTLQQPGSEPEAITALAAAAAAAAATAAGTLRPVEIGGPPGPEPTRYGDWERRGRCIDF
jgi:hypothetical protein